MDYRYGSSTREDVGKPCNSCAYFVFLEFFLFFGRKGEKQDEKTVLQICVRWVGVAPKQVRSYVVAGEKTFPNED